MKHQGVRSFNYHGDDIFFRDYDWENPLECSHLCELSNRLLILESPNDVNYHKGSASQS